MWRDQHRRSVSSDGHIRHLKFVLLSCRDPNIETTTIPTIELQWERGSYELSELDCTLDRPVYLQLPEPVLVTGYRIQTSNEENGADPMRYDTRHIFWNYQKKNSTTPHYSWLVYGLRGSRMKNERAMLLSEVLAYDMPTERSAWTPIIDVVSDPHTQLLKRRGKGRRDGKEREPHLERTKSKKKLSCPQITVPPPTAESSEGKHSPHGSQQAQPILSAQALPGSPRKSPKRKLHGLSRALHESEDFSRIDMANVLESGGGTPFESPILGEDADTKKKGNSARKYAKPEKWELSYLQVRKPPPPHTHSTYRAIAFFSEHTIQYCNTFNQTTHRQRLRSASTSTRKMYATRTRTQAPCATALLSVPTAG